MTEIGRNDELLLCETSVDHIFKQFDYRPQ